MKSSVAKEVEAEGPGLLEVDAGGLGIVGGIGGAVVVGVVVAIAVSASQDDEAHFGSPSIDGW